MEFINLFVIIVSFLCQMLMIIVNGSPEKPVRSKCFTDNQLVLFVVQLLFIILDGGSCRLRSCAVRNISSVFGSVRPNRWTEASRIMFLDHAARVGRFVRLV